MADSTRDDPTFQQARAVLMTTYVTDHELRRKAFFIVTGMEYDRGYREGLQDNGTPQTLLTSENQDHG